MPGNVLIFHADLADCGPHTLRAAVDVEGEKSFSRIGWEIQVRRYNCSWSLCNSSFRIKRQEWSARGFNQTRSGDSRPGDGWLLVFLLLELDRMIQQRTVSLAGGVLKAASIVGHSASGKATTA